MYRLSSDLAPYATHPDMPQFHGMVRESARAEGHRRQGEAARYPAVVPPLAVRRAQQPRSRADQKEHLGSVVAGGDAGPDGAGTGSRAGDPCRRHLWRPRSSAARWVETWKMLPEHVRRRLVLEHDDLRFSAADMLWIHEQTGVRLIFDYQHFWCLNPEGLDMRETLQRILRTWPDGVRPKIHFSSPRTELRQVKRTDRKTRKSTLANVLRSGPGMPISATRSSSPPSCGRGGSGVRHHAGGEVQGPGAGPAAARHAALRSRRGGPFGLTAEQAEELERQEAALMEAES